MIFFCISVFSQAYAQRPQGYEYLDSRTYDVLESWEARGLIGAMPIVMPYQRQEIYKALQELKSKDSLLTKTDRYWLKLLYRRMTHRYNGGKRWKGMRYNLDLDDGFTVYDKLDNSYNILPIVYYASGFENGVNMPVQQLGVDFRSNLFQRVAIDYRGMSDRFESTHFNLWRDFSAFNHIRANLNHKDPSNSLASFYNETYTLSAHFKWISLSAGKNAFKVGEAENGQIILSDKATPILNIRMDITPTPWLRFTYFHGELVSRKLSDNKYPTNSPQVLPTSGEYRSKYLVFHSLTIRPFKKFQFTIGESVVYSDKLQLRYFIPFTVYRVYANDESSGVGFQTIDNPNSQLFALFSLKNLVPRSTIYGEIMVDELNGIDNLFTSKSRNQLAYTLGVSMYDYIFKQSKLTLEYTRILPFVYRNINPAQTFESSNLLMGHWLGDDADIWYASYAKTIHIRWDIRLWGKYARKGYSGTYEEQYNQGFVRPFNFLHKGVRNYYTEAGVSLVYHFRHLVHAHVQYVWRQHTGEHGVGDIHMFKIGIRFGIL